MKNMGSLLKMQVGNIVKVQTVLQRGHSNRERFGFILSLFCLYFVFILSLFCLYFDFILTLF